jgi:hypothetical protein
LFYLPVLHFWKKVFCLLRISLWGVSLWHFHVYMYYNLNWFMPSIFFLSTLVSFYGDFNRLKTSMLILV